MANVFTFGNVLVAALAFCGVNCVFTSKPAVPSFAECLDGWTVYHGSCYLFSQELHAYSDALKYCANYSATVVHIETHEENTFIQSALRNLRVASHVWNWINLSDQLVEGIWKWNDTDTEPLFTDWYISQPDQKTGANCAVIHVTLLKWFDVPCTHKHNPICEKRFADVSGVNIVG